MKSLDHKVNDTARDVDIEGDTWNSNKEETAQRPPLQDHLSHYTRFSWRSKGNPKGSYSLALRVFLLLHSTSKYLIQ